MNAQIERKIGENIRRLRLQAGMTQDLLAAKLRLAGCDTLLQAENETVHYGVT